MIDLNKLKELAEKATPGPWKLGRARISQRARRMLETECAMHAVDGPKGIGDYEDWGYTRANAEYMAAVSPDVTLALLDRLKLAEDAIAQLADLKRYDPNRGRSNAGRTITLNVPAMNLAALDAVIRGMKP